MTNLIVENLSVSRNGRPVLQDISFTAQPGEFIGLIGPNGTGKTTLMRAMLGLLPHTGHCNLSSLSADAKAKLVSWLPQARDVAWPMSVSSLVALGRQPYKTSTKEDDDAVANAIADMELTDLAERPATELSGGETARALIARCLAQDTSIFMADEPLAALDKNLRESMQYEIKHIHENIGVTVVYVTHDQGEALTMSNRIAVFNDGKVQQLSSPDKLYEEPVNSFVAEFIGENNTFGGEVTDISKDVCKVKLQNGEILANPISVTSKGDKTTVSIRPERALINPKDKMDNNQTGKIEEVIYHGDHTRVRLDLLGNKEFILKVPNSSNELDLKLGNEIKVGWNSQDARALDPK